MKNMFFFSKSELDMKALGEESMNLFLEQMRQRDSERRYHLKLELKRLGVSFESCNLQVREVRYFKMFLNEEIKSGNVFTGFGYEIIYAICTDINQDTNFSYHYCLNSDLEFDCDDFS